MEFYFRLIYFANCIIHKEIIVLFITNNSSETNIYTNNTNAACNLVVGKIFPYHSSGYWLYLSIQINSFRLLDRLAGHIYAAIFQI